jgi:hypothetical protein
MAISMAIDLPGGPFVGVFRHATLQFFYIAYRAAPTGLRVTVSAAAKSGSRSGAPDAPVLRFLSCKSNG